MVALKEGKWPARTVDVYILSLPKKAGGNLLKQRILIKSEMESKK